MSERHQPRIWMMLLSTLVTNNDNTPEARRDRAETPEARKPKSVPKIWTVVWWVLVMRVGVTDRILEPVPVYTQLNGPDKGSLCDHKWNTRR